MRVLFGNMLLVRQTFSQGFSAHLAKNRVVHDLGKSDHRRGRTRTPSGGGPPSLSMPNGFAPMSSPNSTIVETSTTKERTHANLRDRTV